MSARSSAVVMPKSSRMDGSTASGVVTAPSEDGRLTSDALSSSKRFSSATYVLSARCLARSLALRVAASSVTSKGTLAVIVRIGSLSGAVRTAFRPWSIAMAITAKKIAAVRIAGPIARCWRSDLQANLGVSARCFAAVVRRRALEVFAGSRGMVLVRWSGQCVVLPGWLCGSLLCVLSLSWNGGSLSIGSCASWP